MSVTLEDYADYVNVGADEDEVVLHCQVRGCHNEYDFGDSWSSVAWLNLVIKDHWQKYHTCDGGRTYMANLPAAGAGPSSWGYLVCGCVNDGYGQHVYGNGR